MTIYEFIKHHILYSVDSGDGLSAGDLYERFKDLGGDNGGHHGSRVAVQLRVLAGKIPGAKYEHCSGVVWNVRIPIPGSLAWSNRPPDGAQPGDQTADDRRPRFHRSDV